MAATPVPCEYAPEHALIERRLRTLEEWKEGVERERMDDYKSFNKTLGEVHEKINAVALDMASVKGRGSGWVQAITMVIATVSMIVAVFFRK